jgi:hypothetical protein
VTSSTDIAHRRGGGNLSAASWTRQPRNAIGDASGLVGRKMIVRKADVLKIVAAMHVGQPHALCVTDDEQSRAVSVHLPRRWKTSFGKAWFHENRMRTSVCPVKTESAMRANPLLDENESLEVAVAQAIEACDGDLRATIRALLLANEFLEAQIDLARIPARQWGTEDSTPIRDNVMGWRSQENCPM